MPGQDVTGMGGDSVEYSAGAPCRQNLSYLLVCLWGEITCSEAGKQGKLWVAEEILLPTLLF